MLDQVPASTGDFIAPADQPEVVRHRPQFSGQTGEYFGIWFVNLLLSIVTLGIYSAWAKVRTERYFYSNTKIAGSSFEYLADPISILKGRLVAYAVVIALGLSSKFSPVLYGALLLSVFAVMPILVVWGMRFRARNSAWRGITYRFNETAGSAYGPFLGWPILSGITLSLLYPLAMRRQQEYVVNGHSFGSARFSFLGQVGKYYKYYGIALAMIISLFVVMSASVLGMMFLQGGSKPSAGVFAVIGVLYLGFFAVGIFLRTRYANMMWNNTRVGPHRFESTQRARDLMWIYFSNAIVIVCTIGLMVPWAMIRLARYRAEHFALIATGSLEEFVADADRKHGAAGAEMVDALDFGADFGI